MPTEPIYHLTTRPDWQSALASGSYTADSLASEGFIHCSTARQVLRSANRYFEGKPDVLVLTIDPDKVRPGIRFENLSGGEDLFPHIYGPLNLDAVLEVKTLTAGIDGTFSEW